MKIYKCIYGGNRAHLEAETQEVIDELFKEYPNGKIENFQSFGCTESVRLFNSIIFETEPKSQDLNPLVIHQILQEIMDRG